MAKVSKSKKANRNQKPTDNSAQENIGFDPQGMADASMAAVGSESPDKASVANCQDQQQDTSFVHLPVPVGACFAGYATSNIDFNATRRQAAAAKVLWCSLSKSGERFTGGRSSNPEGTTVEGVNDGLRWLLDQLADAIEEDSGRELVLDFDLSF